MSSLVINQPFNTLMIVVEEKIISKYNSIIQQTNKQTNKQQSES
jgi:hypothetical protein